MRIFTAADVPDELAQEWLQHLRDFDAAHAGCHFQVLADAPGVSTAEILEALKVEPPLAFVDMFVDVVKKQ
jgi:hypothetical protein